MSLSSEEYRDHLQSTSVRAGFSFDEVVLPDERRVGVNGLHFRYLDWGDRRKAADPVSAWRRTDRAHLGSVLPGVARRLSLHGARSARPWRQRLGARRQLFDRRAARGRQRLCRRRSGSTHFVLVGMSMGAINGLAYAIALSRDPFGPGADRRRPQCASARARAASAISSMAAPSRPRWRRSSSARSNSIRGAIR